MYKALLICMFLLATVASSWAAVVRLVEESPGTYRIDGESLDGVAALDLTINYDASTLAFSGTTQGALLSGSLFAANYNQPGLVRIGSVGTRSLVGSGTLVRLQGSATTSPVVLGFRAKLTDEAGNALPVRTEYPKGEGTQPSVPAEGILPDESAPIATPFRTARNMHPASLGGSTVPSSWEEDGGGVETTAPVSEVSDGGEWTVEEDPSGEVDSRPDIAGEPYIEKRESSFVSALERFRQYEGPRTLEKMVSLFGREGTLLQQRPAIALTDGESPVELELAMSGGKATSVALGNADLLWSGVGEDDRLLVRCVPKAGVVSAKVLLLDREQMNEVPLTVAPPVSLAAIKVSEHEPLPRLDLNGDGEFSWEDDYVLVANLLVQRETGQNPKPDTQQGHSEASR